MIQAASAMVPTTKRPIPMRARDDLVAKRIEYRGEGTWVLKDPVALKYHRLLSEQYCIFRALDGSRNLEEIRDQVRREFPTQTFSLMDVQGVVTDLHRKGLVLTDRPGQGAVLFRQEKENRRRKLLNAMQSLLYLRLPGWDPERTLRWMYPLVRWMFQPWAVAAVAVLVVSSWLLLAVQFDHFRSTLPEFQQFFGWPNLIYLWITLSVAKIIHEFGHGLSCKHYGGECHEMGMMLLVFSPCLYCDVSDSWMLRDKWQRIAIAAAGMYIEVIISAVAIFVWWNTTSGLLHHLCLNIFFVTAVTTVVFNANPLMRFDGYYILSDWLEIPNLRPKADQMLRDKFAWYCLGIESKPDPFLPQSGRVWFVLFAIAASLYRWIVLFAILLFLYTVLKPYGLQSLGILLAVVSFSGIVFAMGKNVHRIISTPRAEPMSYRKLFVSLAVVAILAAAVLMVPLPLHIESSFLVEPAEEEKIFVVTPGRLVEIAVKPGQHVEPGTLLVRLENAEKQDERRALLIQQDVQQVRVELFETMEDGPQQELARVRLESIDRQLEELDEQLGQLMIVAGSSGFVVAPRYKNEQSAESTGDALPGWYGTPLERRNLQCQLEKGTQLLSIAQSAEYKAVILVDQADRNDIFVGQVLELKFGHLPDETYSATVEEISERFLEFAPEALSNKSGSELATVILKEDTELIRAGMQGRARFLVKKRSAAGWIWRYLLQTFHFRL